MDGASTTTAGDNAARFIPTVLIFVALVSWERCLMSPLMTSIHSQLLVADNKSAQPMAGGVA
jgi:hypothetical protein